MNELRRVSAVMLIVYAIIALAAFYWTAVGAEALRPREDNPRLVEAEMAIRRGNIVDWRGILLATTTTDYDGLGLRRLYPHAEVVPVTGYYSRRFGVSGVEAAYDALLRGAAGITPLQQWEREALHQPAAGGDVRLTLDLDVQAAAARALDGRTGAVVLATVPDGSIRAMVSAPLFNANLLDENWEQLIAAPDAPLVNRVTQGIYPPGGLLQTIFLGLALSHHTPVDTVLPDGAEPVTVDGLTLSCLVTPPAGEAITLRQAYTLGCPGAFAQLDTLLEPELIDGAFWRSGLILPPTLSGQRTETGDSPLPLALLQDEEEITAEILGQGALSITPLQALEVAAAIANDGNAPPFEVIDATRPPGVSTWTIIPRTGLARAVFTRQTAEQLRLAMQTAASSGVAAAAQAQTTFPVMGHAATALTGPEATPLQWFIGLIRFNDGSAVVVAVVLENAATPDEAAQVGGLALDAAARAFAPGGTAHPSAQ